MSIATSLIHKDMDIVDVLVHRFNGSGYQINAETSKEIQKIALEKLQVDIDQQQLIEDGLLKYYN